MKLTPVYIALDFDGVLHHCGVGPTPEDFDIFDMVDKQCPGSPYARYAFLGNLLDEGDHPLVAGPNWDLDPKGLFNTEGRLFDRESLLVDLLQKVPAARIVLTTSWCSRMTMDQLCKLLSVQVRSRVEAALIPHPDEKNADGTRGYGMKKWLAVRGEPDAKWVALDDQERHYKDHADHLVNTPNRGLNDVAVARAVAKLRAPALLAQAHVAALAVSSWGRRVVRAILVQATLLRKPSDSQWMVSIATPIASRGLDGNETS